MKMESIVSITQRIYSMNTILWLIIQGKDSFDSKWKEPQNITALKRKKLGFTLETHTELLSHCPLIPCLSHN